MKTYSAPRLVSIGSVVERTQGSFSANVDGGEQQLYAPGSVGFNL